MYSPWSLSERSCKGKDTEILCRFVAFNSIFSVLFFRLRLYFYYSFAAHPWGSKALLVNITIGQIARVFYLPRIPFIRGE